MLRNFRYLGFFSLLVLMSCTPVDREICFFNLQKDFLPIDDGAYCLARNRDLKIQAKVIDADKDGFISQNEFSSYLEKRFTFLDKNKDNKLDIHEYMKPLILGKDKGKSTYLVMSSKKCWMEIDGNEDDFAEKMTFLIFGSDHYFAADLDGDGKVSVKEFQESKNFRGYKNIRNKTEILNREMGGI